MTVQYDEIVRREIVTTRVFDAPRDVVFGAWTDPEQLKIWWGPKGFTNTFHHIDIKAGGSWSYIMHGPDGHNYPNEMQFIEVTAPERIVIDHTSYPQFRLTVLFHELGDRTKITFRQLFETSDIHDQVNKRALRGNEESLERLANIVAGRPV